MVVSKKLKVCQLDVKGTYLNGILTQPIYMEQPIGFDDGSGLVCLLIKSIYGLKQAGRVWNIEFDRMIQRHGFQPLISDSQC
jgi:Reverse transcriptase (RNA-dependent DNA polymerase)